MDEQKKHERYVSCNWNSERTDRYVDVRTPSVYTHLSHLNRIAIAKCSKMCCKSKVVFRTFVRCSLNLWASFEHISRWLISETTWVLELNHIAASRNGWMTNWMKREHTHTQTQSMSFLIFAIVILFMLILPNWLSVIAATKNEARSIKVSSAFFPGNQLELTKMSNYNALSEVK